MICPTCHLPLGESILLRVRGQDGYLKSCARCSSMHGVHLFYPLTAFRERAMGEDAVAVEPWCEACVTRAGNARGALLPRTRGGRLKTPGTGGRYEEAPPGQGRGSGGEVVSLSATRALRSS